ncbi:MAG: S-methyl-5-thioribose-1-phosphate isomerase [Thaumarchaeota archaeon]|nr:S-methyl-5-thioribose-1-phosphate isomerase [Candidatus Calditenuaceae archaeon]MDW8187525.1 S-methyl-5-thioribose-1-phosphate isomerase [Nitrososphaerota archaeon]
MKELRTLYWKASKLYVLDQRVLPHRVRYVVAVDYRGVARAIKDMTVRGAPAIGVAAAYGLALAAVRTKGLNPQRALERLQRAADVLRSTRPTAVNLFWAIDRVLSRAERAVTNGENLADAVLEEAHRMAEEDVEVNRTIGRNGAQLVRDGARVMTYCNAGALATVGYGTALGVIRAAVEQGKRVFVYVPETRPKLQGARLTSFELKTAGIEHKVISDNTAPFLMSRGEVDLVVVGADRILATSGHVINKIGTLSLALAANYFGVPFYVAAPVSTIDFVRSLPQVKIEERDEREVLEVSGKRIAPRGVRAINYAFDVTPPELVRGIITERGVIRPDELMALRERAGV